MSAMESLKRRRGRKMSGKMGGGGEVRLKAPTMSNIAGRTLGTKHKMEKKPWGERDGYAFSSPVR